jgi:diacylglycerol kinase family enzyme
MQNISVYLNSRASNSDVDWKSQIDSALFRSSIEYKAPAGIDQLYIELDSDIENNVDAIMSVGGDGTVNTIIQRLAGTEVGLFVIPGGTANDFAKALGSSQNIKKMSQTIRQNIRKKIDLIMINDRFMATNGGIGFASEVASEINQIRHEFPHFKNFMKLSGKSVYSMFLAKKLLTKEIETYKFKIESSNLNDTIDSPLILINNQPILGGTFNVAPHTVHNDGKFNITIFKHSNRLELISALLKILSNEFPYDDKNIVSFETEHVKIELLGEKEGLSFFGDGEVFKEEKVWNIKLYPQFLTVFSPNDQRDLTNICTKVSLI